MEKSANEALGKKINKYRKKQGIKIWNGKIEEAIKQKQKSLFQLFTKSNRRIKKTINSRIFCRK
jgi:hypothetical protein